MPGRVRFVCLLHSHQPVGNFDHVIEEACNLSYIPYVDAFEKHPQIPLTHHISGCLLEWLEADEEALELLMEKLLKRRKQVPDLITDCRKAKINPFPKWV